MSRFEISALLVGILGALVAITFACAQNNAYRWAQYEACMASGTPYAVCTNPRLSQW